MNNKNIIIAVIAIALLAGAGFWYWSSKKKSAPAGPTVNVHVTEKAGESIGSAIFEKTKNPITDKLPETNPLKQIIKNPF